MNPEWTPPRGLRDPYIRRLNRDRAQWDRTIRGQLDTLADYAVARALASYGNKDGTRCRPGTRRLANDLSSSEDTVRRALARLSDTGWITLVNPGPRGRGQAQEFRLTVPAPHAAACDLWTDENGAQWMERPPGMPRPPEGSHHSHPSGNQEGSHHSHPSGGKGSHGGQKGSHQRREKGGTGATPPGSTHQESSHHSAKLRSRPPAAAAGARATEHHFDPDADGIADQLADHLEDLGYVPDSTLIDAMLAAGRHPNAIVNTVMTQQTGATW